MLQQFSQWNKTRTYLLLANILLVFFLVLLNNLNVIPLKTSDFIFFAILALALALYRPGWAFLFFVGTIVLENINLAPLEWGISIRPFQLLGAVTVAALAIRFISRRINFELTKLKWPDYLLIILILAGFVSALVTSDKTYSLKLSLILATFLMLYFLTRSYIQNLEDLKKVIPFFLSSAVVVVLYGIWQNWRFTRGLANFEVMPGRPNATFMEADWLGMYMVLLISVCYSLVYYIQKKYANSTGKIFNFQFSIFNKFSISNDQNSKRIIILGLYLLFIFSFILLILTVSRSAWLGAVFVTILFLFITLTGLRFKNWQWKIFFQNSLGVLLTVAISLGSVYIFHLTDFQLFNRAQSTGTGAQKITISCWLQKCSEIECVSREMPPIENIKDTSELEKFGCRHINLEEIQSEIEKNNFVKEIFRRDPNFSTRRVIYQKSWEQIKTHPILGIGWGSISSILGADERGTRLNSSNIFLEVWLGAGIIGLLAFLAVWLYIIFSAIKRLATAEDFSQKAFDLFLILGWLGLSVTNMFNAGLFLGFFWLFLALALV